MGRRTVATTLGLACVVCAAVAYGLRDSGARRAAAEPLPAPRRPAPPPAAPAPAPPALETREPLRYLGVGGGPLPESTEVSLEQNLQLLRDTMAGPGALLFAGGGESRSVRVLRPGAAPDPLLVRLGELFLPRLGRDSGYRKSTLAAANAASLAEVEAELVRALDAPAAAPLLVYFATHGEQAEEARDNTVLLWGGTGLSAIRLAQLHDAHPRPLRVVAASCFSGGFAELAFEQADARRGAARAPRCGLFAGTWDRETSGCDPDPDRKRQEGYSLHFLHALRRQDRDGKPLPQDRIDFDGDGRISLLEAHARAGIAGRSIDVPTTTSERYLRAVQRTRAAPEPALLPELHALVQQLGAQLGMGDERAARARAQLLRAELDEIDAAYDELEAEQTARHGELSARLLGRYPVLDDPYHPEFAATLARERAAIERALDDWPEAQRHAAVQRELSALSARYDALDVEEAQLTRLLLAYETEGLAAGLRRKGGVGLRHYQALLTCERSVPELTAGTGAAAAPAGARDARVEPRYR
jgi:hypothetical protein